MEVVTKVKKIIQNLSKGIFFLLLLSIFDIGYATTSNLPEKSDTVDFPIKIIKVRFSAFDVADKDNPKLIKSKILPKRDKILYGWYVFIDSIKPEIKWREEIDLPAPTDNIEVDNKEINTSYTISPDKRHVTTEKIVKNTEKSINNYWKVFTTDPSGIYKMRIYIEGKFIKEFTFELKLY